MIAPRLWVWIGSPDDVLDVLRYVKATERDILNQPVVRAELERLAKKRDDAVAQAETLAADSISLKVEIASLRHRQKQLEAVLKESAKACDEISEALGSPSTWELGITRAREATAEIARLTKERDEARANYRFMVERAADEKLDGYRELGARAARAEQECDEAMAEVERVKREGLAVVDSRNRDLRAEVARLTKEVE